MTDRITEIKARVAQHRSSDDPYRAVGWMMDDLEYALGEIDTARKEILRLRAGYLTDEIDRLRAALLGLLTFRTNKDYWECFSDEQLKPLLDDAFAKAREALEDGK